MRNTKLLILTLLLVYLLFTADFSFAEVPGLSDIGGQSGNATMISSTEDSVSGSLRNIIENFLVGAKSIFNGILLIIIVYAGAMMIISMGTNEESLSKSKRILRYSAVGLFFINMPGTIYNALKGSRNNTGGGIASTWGNEVGSYSQNLFFSDTLIDTINTTFVIFLKFGLVSLAIIIIILSGLQIIMSRGKDENVTKAKNRIIWSIIGLIFVGFIQVWQQFVYSGDIPRGTDIFEAAANLALFLAVPVAVFFLTLAGYYYITANGDEEKTKKGKNIIIHVLVGTLILLASVTFLYDLIDL